MSFKTSFDSKQPKLEPKLVSALSETKHLFWLFRVYIKTKIFDVSIEPKETEDQPKQFDREHILVFLWKFRIVSACFGLFRFVSKQFCFFRNKLKQNRNRSCFGLFRFELKFLFLCFEDTLVPGEGERGSPSPSLKHIRAKQWTNGINIWASEPKKSNEGRKEI